MARFDFVNPGGAAADAVSRYFDELHARRREKLSDQLGFDRERRLAEQHAANIEMQKAQLASIDEQRKANIEAAAQKTFTDSRMVGDEVSAEDAKRFPGLVATSPIVQGAQIAVSEDDIPTYDVSGGQTTFRGTPEQRQTAEAKATREAYIKTLDPNSQQAKFLAAQVALGDNTLPYQMFQEEQTGRIVRAGRDGTLQVQDPTTGQLRPFGPNDKPFNKDVDQLINEPAPPSSPMGLFDPAAAAAYGALLQQGAVNPTITRGNMGVMNQVLGGMTPDSARETGANRTGYVADQGALTQITRSLSAISAFEETAQKNIGQMKLAMKGVTDTGIPILNAPIRDLQRMAGSPEVAKYQASIRVVIPELARILTQPNLTGQLTDQARHEIESVVRGDATVAQANAVIDLLIQDMQNRKTSLIAQQGALTSGIKQRGSGGVPGVVTPGEQPLAETPDARRARLRNYMPQPR